MPCRTRLLLVASCILAVPVAWAFPPYHPHPAYVQGVSRPAAYPYARLPAAAYPQVAYRPYPSVYPPRPAPAPATRPAAAVEAPLEPAAAATEGKVNVARSKAGHQAEFLERLRPLVESENARLLELRREASSLVEAVDQGKKLRKAQRHRLRELARDYRVDGDPLEGADARVELLRKIDVLPVSLALAQAANESAWGRSRFAQEGNNLFGIWTYDESQGIVPRKRAAGKKHLVRRFDSIEASVRYYLFTLNSHPAYAELRAIRAELRAKGKPLDGHALADGLTRYSAKGEDYVRMIQAMIRRFDLAAFDAAGDRKA